MAKRILASVLGILLLLSLLAAGAGFYVYQQLTKRTADPVVFDIERGSNLSEVVGNLINRDVLAVNGGVIKAYTLLTRSQGAIQAGQYQIDAGLDVRGVIALFRSGRVIQHRVTFPEGWTFKAWRQHLAERPYLKQETANLSRAEVADLLGIEGDPEGWFFPDTYQYIKGDSDLEILSLAHQEMQQALNETWATRGVLTGIDTQYQALILASVIEKETGYGPDRVKVGSVFHNRLATGMRLQSDPTTIYGLGDSFDGDLKRVHLRTDTPYNTYTRHGLPPTPICSPGVDSIRAAVTGSEHPYFYFVAKGDGLSHFSISLAEHNAAVNRYQRNRQP